MIKIPIDINGKEKLIIADEKQWMVGKYVKSGDSQKFVADAYLSSVEGLMRYLFETKLRAADANSLGELQMVVKQVRDDLAGIYETLPDMT